MTGVLVWINRHRRLLKLGSAFAALVLVMGGIAAGMTTASSSPEQSAEQPTESRAPAKPNQHYMVGVVAGLLGAGQALVRADSGRFVIVEFDRQTVVHRSRQRVLVNAVRRGSRVIILGEPRNDRLHADVVTITGTVPLRQLPQRTPPVPTPAPKSPTTVLKPAMPAQTEAAGSLTNAAPTEQTP